MKVCMFGLGLIFGVTAGVVGMLPKTQPSRAWVENAQRQVRHLDTLSEAQQKRFWEVTMANQQLREAWAVRLALADVGFAR